MPRRVLVQRGGEHFDLVEVRSPDEHSLQEVMKDRVQLIPSDDLGLDGTLRVLGRETALASGRIDLLCLSRSGELVLIEFKTGPQNPDFRHALAQVVDYGSDLWRLSPDEFDHGVVRTYLASGHHAGPTGGTDLTTAVRAAWQLSHDDESALRDRLTQVLRTGDFHYVIAAQRFTPTMERSVDYLNATMRHGRFFLVEIIRLEGAEYVGHAAQVVASPAGRAANGTTGKANEVDFLERISDGAYRSAMRDIFARANTLGLLIAWGTRGASMRMRTPDRGEPVSIGWTFLDRDQWYGARHLTFGVDPATLDTVPSVRAPLEAFVARVKAVPGARLTPGKLDAATFEPSVVPTVKDALISAMETLVQSVAGT